MNYNVCCPGWDHLMGASGSSFAHVYALFRPALFRSLFIPFFHSDPIFRPIPLVTPFLQARTSVKTSGRPR